MENVSFEVLRKEKVVCNTQQQQQHDEVDKEDENEVEVKKTKEAITFWRRE